MFGLTADRDSWLGPGARPVPHRHTPLEPGVTRLMPSSVSSMPSFTLGSDGHRLIPLTLTLGRRWTFQLDELRESPDTLESAGWYTTGRFIHVRIRMHVPHRFPRTDIELVPWSYSTTQLRLTPASKRVWSWGPRRQRRFWHLLHQAADELVRILTSEAAP
jgi:hypothetical protein